MFGLKMEELRDGEVLFFNVDEEDKPYLLEAMKDFDDAEADEEEVNGEEIEVSQVPTLCSGTCNPLVPFCIIVTFPSRTRPGTFFQLGVDTSCVSCVVEPCVLTDVTVPNPCPGQQPITCNISVNRVRAVGSITAGLSAEYLFNCGTNFFGNAPVLAGTTATFCVDNVLCFTCSETPCPRFCEGTVGLMLVSQFLSTDRCGNNTFLARGFFVLPNCV